MVSFNGINLYNSGIPLPSANASGAIADAYDNLSEKKDNYLAVTLANKNNTDERASATKIGAFGSLIIGAAKLAINLTRNMKPYKNPILNWFMNGSNSYIKFMKKHKIGHSPTVIGACAYIASSMAIGSALGYVVDKCNTAKNTRIDGRISNVKSGVNGSWIQSGLKSLSATNEGKQTIKDSIRKNDDGSVTVKFNGVNKEYNITKQELKDSSRAYVTYKSDDGQTVTGFKKKFSKGDGDVLACEVAFEKYCKDVANGNVPENKNLPKSMYSYTDSGDVIFSTGRPNQLYYLLTGKKSERNNPSEAKDAVMTIYDKENLRNFIEDYKLHPKNYAVEIMLKDENSDKPKIAIPDKLHMLHSVKNGSRYAIEVMDGKTAIISNSENTKDKMIIPFKNLEKYIAEANYVDLTKQE